MHVEEIQRVQQCVTKLQARAEAAEAQVALDSAEIRRLKTRIIQQDAMLMFIGAENSRYEGFMENYLLPLITVQKDLFMIERASLAETLRKSESNFMQKELKTKREIASLRRENVALKEAMQSTVQGRRLLSDAMRQLGSATEESKKSENTEPQIGEIDAMHKKIPDMPARSISNPKRTSSPQVSRKSPAPGAFSQIGIKNVSANHSKTTRGLTIDDLFSPIPVASEKSFAVTPENSLVAPPPNMPMRSKEFGAASDKHAEILHHILAQRDDRIAQLEAENALYLKQITSRILR